jgi:hypothetical protein
MTDANPPNQDPTERQEAPATQAATSNDPGGEGPPDDTSVASGDSANETQPTGGRGDAAGPATARGGDTGSRLVRVVEYATFGILSLLALVATFRFYFAASEAIRVWFSSDFVPVFQAAFNLVVVIAAAIGVSVLIRRIKRK